MASLLPRTSSQFAITHFLSTVPTMLPPDKIISGFPEYAAKLTSDQHKLLDNLAQEIVMSHSGFTPIVAVSIIGHSDRDLRADNPERKPGESPEQFEMRISGARANRAREALLAKVRVLSRGKFIHLIEEFLTDPRRSRTIAMGATDLAAQHPKDEIERKLNRRVEFHLVRAFVPDPDPPKPDPKPDLAELPNRTSRLIELLQKRQMPSGQVQTNRLKCMMAKLRDKAAVDDRFVDGDLTTVVIKGQRIPGLQDIVRSYGVVSDADFEHFFQRAKIVVVAIPQLATSASDDEAIAAMDQIDRRILKAIAFINSHLNRFGIAADPTKTRLNDFISKGQINQNSIYSCR